MLPWPRHFLKSAHHWESIPRNEKLLDSVMWKKGSTHDVIKNHSQAKKEIEFCYFHWWIKGCSFVSFHCAYNSYFQRGAKIPIRNKTQKLQPQKMNGELSIHLRAHRAACHISLPCHYGGGGGGGGLIASVRTSRASGRALNSPMLLDLSSSLHLFWDFFLWQCLCFSIFPIAAWVNVQFTHLLFRYSGILFLGNSS